jgi:DNA-binding NtrC family response regulator
MCDILLIAEDGVAGRWFDKSLDSLSGKWAQVSSVENAAPLIRHEPPGVILVGTDTDLTELQHLVYTLPTKTLVVVVGLRFDPGLFQTALACGVHDFWVAPVEVGSLASRMASPRLAVCAEAENGISSTSAQDTMIIGHSKEMVKALRMASLMAKTDTAVLIRGESGTGKELLAREIHDLSGRTGPFIALNCAAVSEGLAESELFGHERGSFTGAVSQRMGCFEQAHTGTLFLDEIGDAPISFQAKLLRVLERNEFTRVGGHQLIRSDFRVIAATNGDLEGLIESGGFRLDLHYRLGAVTLAMPALRDRKDDIPELISKLVGRLNKKLHLSVKGVSHKALEQMMAYDWPGNLRELYHVLHRAVLLCRRDVVEVEHLLGVGAHTSESYFAKIRTLSELEEEHISLVLKIAAGNKGRACDLLGISRPTLRRKLRQYEMAFDSVPA